MKVLSPQVVPARSGRMVGNPENGNGGLSAAAAILPFSEWRVTRPKHVSGYDDKSAK